MPSVSDHALNMTRWQVVKTVVKCIFPKSLSHRQGMSNVKFLMNSKEIVRFSAVNIAWGLPVLPCHYS